MGELPLQKAGQFIDLTVSLDASRLAYRIDRAGGQVVVLDGVEGSVWEHVDRLLFSADSAHFAYVAKRESRTVVVRDGVEGRRA